MASGSVDEVLDALSYVVLWKLTLKKVTNPSSGVRVAHLGSSRKDVMIAINAAIPAQLAYWFLVLSTVWRQFNLPTSIKIGGVKEQILDDPF